MGTKPYILYDNVLGTGLTATSTDATDDYSVDYLYNSKPFQKWKSTSSAEQHIDMDMGSAKTINSVALIGHNLFTVGGGVSVQGSTTGTGGWMNLFTEVPDSDLVFIRSFTETSAYRYVRVKLIGGSGAYEIGDIILCDRLEFPQFPDAPFAPRAVESVNASTMRSQGGHILGGVSRYTPIEINVSFTWPVLSFVDGDYYTFWENHGRELKPFVWVPNYGEYPTYAYFVAFNTKSKLAISQTDVTNAEKLSLRMVGALI